MNIFIFLVLLLFQSNALAEEATLSFSFSHFVQKLAENDSGDRVQCKSLPTENRPYRLKTANVIFRTNNPFEDHSEGYDIDYIPSPEDVQLVCIAVYSGPSKAWSWPKKPVIESRIHADLEFLYTVPESAEVAEMDRFHELVGAFDQLEPILRAKVDSSELPSSELASGEISGLRIAPSRLNPYYIAYEAFMDSNLTRVRSIATGGIVSNAGNLEKISGFKDRVEARLLLTQEGGADLRGTSPLFSMDFDELSQEKKTGFFWRLLGH